MRIRLFALNVILVLILTACKKDKVSDAYIDYSYFPTEVGKWVVYDCVQITIDHPVNVYDTLRFQIKEIVESKFMDDNGQEVMRIERYYRSNDSSAWQIKDVWVAQIINATAQKVEENMRYIKLAFPIYIGKSWNGNAYNIYDYQEYEVTDMAGSLVINNLEFDKVVTVTQAYDSSLINKNHQLEKYAKDVGLVYKYSIDIDSDISVFNPITPIEERITTGVIYTQEAINYGE